MINAITNAIGVLSTGETFDSLVKSFTTRVIADGGVVESEDCLLDRITNLKNLGLWDKASAIWMPHGYKEGKLYAVKGGANADLGFTRAGTRTRKGPTYVEEVPSYNLLRYSQSGFSNTSYWIKLGSPNVSISDDSVIAPDGTLTASRFTNNDGGSSRGIRQSVLLGIDSFGIFTLSFWAKSDDGVTIYGDVTDDGETVVAALTPVWTKYSRTVTGNAPGLFVDIVFGPATPVGLTFDLWGAELVQGSELPSNYSKTTNRFNVPALDYSSSTCPALSLEPARTNLLVRSEEFDNATWVKSNLTVTANSITSPDGLSTGDKISESSGGSNACNVMQAITKAGSSAQYTFSASIKASERNWARLQCQSGSNGARAWFDLSTGTIGTQSILGAGFTLQSTNIVEQSDGWYKCSITFSSDSAISMQCFLCIQSADDQSVYTTVIGNGLYVWGAQLEVGSYATSYIPTTTGTVTRIADTIPGFYPEKTNIFLQSEDFSHGAWSKGASTVTSNATESPTGTLTAGLLIEDDTSNRHRITGPGMSVYTGEVYTLSVYAKKKNHDWIQLNPVANNFNTENWANFNLSNGTIGNSGAGAVATIISTGNGWYRLTLKVNVISSGTTVFPNLVVTTNNTDSSRYPLYLGTLAEVCYLWGGQLEVGGVVTTYKPTTTTPVHDGSVIGQTEGTLYFEGSTFADASNKNFLTIFQDSASYIEIGIITTNAIRANIRNSGTFESVMDSGVITTGELIKCALIYRQNYAALFINGVKVNQDLFVNIPSCSQIRVGSSAGGGQFFYGNGNNWGLSTTAISDTEAITLTTT